MNSALSHTQKRHCQAAPCIKRSCLCELGSAHVAAVHDHCWQVNKALAAHTPYFQQCGCKLSVQSVHGSFWVQVDVTAPPAAPMKYQGKCSLLYAAQCTAIQAYHRPTCNRQQAGSCRLPADDAACLHPPVTGYAPQPQYAQYAPGPYAPPQAIAQPGKTY